MPLAIFAAQYIIFVHHIVYTNLIGSCSCLHAVCSLCNCAGMFSIAVFHVLFAMLLWSLWQTFHVQPGSIPRTRPWTDGSFALTEEDKQLRQRIAGDGNFNCASASLDSAWRSFAHEFADDVQNESVKEAVRSLPLVETYAQCLGLLLIVSSWCLRVV